jgi:hypothetical protein
MDYPAPIAAENIPFGSNTQPATSAYEAPAVIYEAPLEVRAGTPFEFTDLVNLGE